MVKTRVNAFVTMIIINHTNELVDILSYKSLRMTAYTLINQIFTLQRILLTISQRVTHSVIEDWT